MKKRSLKFNLIAAGILAALVPLAVVGTISVEVFSNKTRAMAENRASLLSKSISDMIDISMRQELTLAKELGQHERIVSGMTELAANGMTASMPMLRSLDRLLKKDSQVASSEYESFFITDSAGRVMADSSGGTVRQKGVNVSNRDYFITASAGQATIGTPVKSKLTGTAVVPVAVPIRDGHGRFLGMFGQLVKLDALSEKLARTRAGKTGYAFVVEKKGLVIAHPDPGVIFKVNITTNKGMDAISHKMVSGKEGVIEYQFNGVGKIAGFSPVPATGWSVAFTQDKAEFMSAIYTVRNITIAAMGIFLVITVVGVLIFVRGVMRLLGKDPAEISAIAERIAQGDLTVDFTGKPSEMTGVFASMKRMSDNLTIMFKDIKGGVQTLTASSTQLSAISDQMAGNSEQTSQRATSVAAASEEMASSMNSVAAATEQTSANIQMIVAAAEEMNATINEIAQNTAKGSDTTSGAVKQAEEISQKVEELGRAASEISNVTETIADISEQTNLLALNATIEAARAGESGKGFAVVAGEIKALAQQTAEATDEISSRVTGIQTTTQESITTIQSIVGVIDEINAIVNSIAAAIEEQAASTQEISNNVGQAATGVEEVNGNVNQSSAVAVEVSRDIQEISGATEEMRGGSTQVNESAVELSKLAESLNEMVGRFKIG